MSKKAENKAVNFNIRVEISRQFRIKVYSRYDNGKSINSLRGYSGLINLIGDRLAVNFMTYAIMSEEQKVTFKLRRGLTITFYSK